MTARTLIPLEVLLSVPERLSVCLSPGGDQIAFSAPLDGVHNAWVQDVGSDAPARAITHDKERGILDVFWAYDGKHLCYLQDNFGDENLHVHALNLDTLEVRDLTPFDGVRAEVIACSSAFPGHLLVALNRDDATKHDAYRLDIATGEIVLLARNPGDVVAPAPKIRGGGWVARRDGTIGAATRAGDAGRMEVVVGDSPDTTTWSTVRSWTLDDTRGSSVVGVADDSSTLYLLDCVDTNTSVFLALDLGSGEVEVLAGDDNYDVTGLARRADRTPVAVMVDRERAHWQALVPELKPIVDEANARPDAHMVGLTCDATASRWLRTWVSPVTGMWWDVVEGARPDEPPWQAGAAFPRLAAYRLPTRTPVSYASRDGFTIHGYLTTPVDQDDRPGPMVLFPHGGPWERDYWDFDPWAAWLADRGYVVLQPNFRGSTGYGKQFLNAGNREWGGKMHDDLVDGVRWAADSGLADPQRVAIFGGSYGGYAALVGATFTPTLFACIVEMFGWGDLVQAQKNLPPYWESRRAQWYARVGNPDTEAEFLWSRSPLSRVDDICRPILIAQGGNDVRVRPEASDQVVAALRERGIEHEYFFFPDEGHGFVNPDNIVTFFAAAETFLERHIGGGGGTPATG